MEVHGLIEMCIYLLAFEAAVCGAMIVTCLPGILKALRLYILAKGRQAMADVPKTRDPLMRNAPADHLDRPRNGCDP